MGVGVGLGESALRARPSASRIPSTSRHYELGVYALLRPRDLTSPPGMAWDSGAPHP